MLVSWRCLWIVKGIGWRCIRISSIAFVLNKLTLIFFLLLLQNSIHGQDDNSVDTFQVNNIYFQVNAIDGWSPFVVHDSVQFTSGWNCKSEFPQKNIPTQPNTFIGVQITNKPLPKTENSKEYTISNKEINGWEATFEDYKPKKIGSCRTCPPLTKKVYTFALNRKQVLTITLHAYLNEPDLTAAVNSFDVFTNQFISTNRNAMVDFGPINFSLQVSTDTFRVQNYFLRAILPMSYKISKSKLNGIYGYEIIDPNDDFIIEVTAVQLDSKSRKGMISDTSVKEVRDVKGFTHVGGYKTAKLSTARYQTKRIIELLDGGCIVVTFSADKGPYDAETSSHSVTRYADLFVASNLYPREYLKRLELGKPDLGSPKNGNAPNKFEMPLPK